MADKSRRASEYRSEQVELVRSTCLYVATRLGDLMDDIVVVGGLFPSLLIDQGALPEGTPARVGTMDLDVGLKLALLDEGRYRTLTGRLRDAGFVPDQTAEGGGIPSGRSGRRHPGGRSRIHWGASQSGGLKGKFTAG